jgi:probable phosphoglycerate mutase
MIPAIPFYLIRHGESEANIKNIAAGGGVDSPLSQLGKQQADALAPFMPKLPVRPSKIFHSPQIRAKETAQRINRHLNLEMIEVPELHEHLLGEWEGLSWNTIKPLVYADQEAPGGESMTTFSKRVKAVLDRILTHDLDAPPLIAAHGGTFHAIGKLYNWSFGHIKNCHLHFFDPAPSPIPWQLWQFDAHGEYFPKTRSEFCPVYLSDSEKACA